MKRLIFSLLILTGFPLSAAEALPTPGNEDIYIVSAQLWARPRSAAAVAVMPPVRQAVQSLLKSENAVLVIRYPGGEEGSLWAEELQSWLVALGVEPALIEMRPGNERSDQIEIAIQGNK